MEGQGRRGNEVRSDLDDLKWQVSSQCTGLISNLLLLFCKTELWHCFFQEASPGVLLVNNQAVLDVFFYSHHNILPICFLYGVLTICLWHGSPNKLWSLNTKEYILFILKSPVPSISKKVKYWLRCH